MNRFFTSDMINASRSIAYFCGAIYQYIFCLALHFLTPEPSFNVFHFSAYLHDDVILAKSLPMTDICVSISNMLAARIVGLGRIS